MLRRTPWPALCAITLALSLPACGDDPAPGAAPSGAARSKAPAQNGQGAPRPLRRRGWTRPEGPAGPQLEAAKIDALLTEARAAVAQKRTPAAERALAQCANRDPASAACDGELGLLLSAHRNRKDEYLFHLSLASRTDDPKANADLYDRVSERLRQHAQLGDAEAAARLALAREDTPARHLALSRVLQLTQDRVPEAADEIAVARTKEDRPEWLREEAILRAQVASQSDQAIDLLKAYILRKDITDAQREEGRVRISQVRQAAEGDPAGGNLAQ